MKKITLTPIGVVKNKVKKPRFGSFKSEVSEIVLAKKYTDALTGIEDYSHVMIVYWMDKVKDKAPTGLRPRFLLPVLRREQNPSEAENSSHSSLPLSRTVSAKWDKVITHRPQGNPNVPVVGIFSCRCPQRPNPIAVTTVKLLGRKQNKLKVAGLDIIDGTPIIDIKPYWPVYDKVKGAKIPNWVNKLDL